MERTRFVAQNAIRLRQAIRHEEPDRVPVNLCPGGPWIASVAGVPLTQYYNDYSAMYEAQASVRDRFHGLIAFRPDRGLVNEPAALGAKVVLGDDGTPWVEPFVRDMDDVRRLKVPDPASAPYMSGTLEAYYYLKSRVAHGTPVAAGFAHAPFGVAALCRGVTQFCMDTVENPDLVRALLDVCTEMVISWLKAQERAAGGFERITLSDDIASFVSPRTFRRFILPLYQRIYGEFPSAERWYHNDADATHLLEGLAEAGVQVFHMGYMVDISNAKKRVGDSICIMGNIPPVEVLRNGTPGDVRACALSVLKAASSRGGLILAPGGYLVEGTPVDNVDAMILAAAEFDPAATEGGE